jgi:hypothetical protein
VKARRSRPEAVAQAIADGDAGQTGAGVLTAARVSATSDKTRSHLQPGSAHVAKAAGEVREKLSARATGRSVERGSNEPWSCSRHVSFAEVDERRPARHHPSAKSRRDRVGSSPAARERRRGEKAPEAGSRRRSRETGGGLLDPTYQKGRGLLRESGGDLRGAFVDGRRSGSKKRRALTGSVWERLSASREMRPAKSRSARETRQGTSEAARQPRTWSTTPR